MKYITIGGCRDYNNYEEFKIYVDRCLSKLDDDITIISGGCRGTDTLAEKYAKEKGYTLDIHDADWNKYGRSAGPIRNREMVDRSQYVIAFWDGKSRGTKSLIDYTRSKQIPIRIIQIKKL